MPAKRLVGAPWRQLGCGASARAGAQRRRSRAPARPPWWLGEGVGGLLNATFGNAAELIIAIVALRAGLFDLVKASITGSIIGNVLLVFGASALWGGLKYQRQQFNQTAAALSATLLVLSAARTRMSSRQAARR